LFISLRHRKVTYIRLLSGLVTYHFYTLYVSGATDSICRYQDMITISLTGQ
jgi:hypothetical protein